MRAYPQSSKKYRKTDAIANEWDVGLTLPEDYQQELDKILLAIASMECVYVLVGGVEYVMPKIGLDDLMAQYKKSGDTIGQHHVHVALIFKIAKTRQQVLTVLNRHDSIYRNYCVVRNNKYPYCTWKYHHIKPEGKVTDCILVERGELPDDDITNPDICEMILRIGTRYGASKEVAIMKNHMLLLEHGTAYKRRRTDPEATKAKAQARLDKYQANWEASTTDEDKTKWSTYITLVKRDHFPELA